MIWLLELLGMPELLCLQGYGGYSGYHGYSAKNSTEGQIIWLLELLGVSDPWGYRVTQVIVVIVVMMVIMVSMQNKSTWVKIIQVLELWGMSHNLCLQGYGGYSGYNGYGYYAKKNPFAAKS